MNYLLSGVAALAAGVLLAYCVRGLWLKYALALLNEREWVILFKLVAIVLMLFVLIYASIAVEFPAEQFIYGRF